MGFLKEYWGTQSGEFVEGFLAALDWVSAIDRSTLKRVIYVDKEGRFQTLKILMEEAVEDLAELPELFEQTIEELRDE